MRDFIAVCLGTLADGCFSFAVAWLYIAVVRHIGRRLLKSWLIFLWFPVHIVFAIAIVLGVFFPFYALMLVRASFPMGNFLNVLAIVFGVGGATPALVYFFHAWQHLRKAIPPNEKA